MTRNARTKQFRKGIQEEYFNNLIEGYKKKIFYDNFEHIYDNKVIVEKAIELGIIVWSFDWWKKEDSISNHPNLSLDWIEKFPYKNWHCERAGLRDALRCMAFMTYLNDVSDGGGTDFKYQNITAPAKKGLTLIWPSDWTHTHKGVVSKTHEKYIVTGWFNFC